MSSALIRAAAYVCCIACGYLLKRIGFFRKEDFAFVSKLVLSVTLPCAVLTNFSKLEVPVSMVLLVACGVLGNVLLIGLGVLAGLRHGRERMAFNAINYGGYNIGCFTMPFVQSFLGPLGVVSASLFDAGNAFICMGCSYALAAGITGRERPSLRSSLKKIFSSVTLDVYVFAAILAFLNIKLPAPVLTFTEIVGSANGFLAMLMIGLGFELHLDKSKARRIAGLLVIRFGFAALFSLLLFRLLPFSLEVRQAVALVAFAPMSGACAAFTYKIDGDVALSSAVNSLAVLVSIVLLMGMTRILGLS